MLQDSLTNLSVFAFRSLRRRSSVKRTSRNTSVAWKKFAKRVKRECAKDAVRTRGIAVVTKVGTGDENLFHEIVDITDVKVAQNLSSAPSPSPHPLLLLFRFQCPRSFRRFWENCFRFKILFTSYRRYFFRNHFPFVISSSVGGGSNATLAD